MISLALSGVFSLSLLAGSPQTYAQAHRINAETGRPIVVLVGADWCPACRKMKTTVLPQAERRGLLKKVALATVNTDREGKLAQQLMHGGAIPQLIMYHKTSHGWQRQELIGVQSVDAIESFINKGLEAPVESLGAN
jgi:thioredoxin-like negative regulator of GroEL